MAGLTRADPGDLTAALTLARCSLAGDRAGAQAVMGAVDPDELVDSLLALAVVVGRTHYGPRGFDNWLAAWLRRRACEQWEAAKNG